MTAIMFLQYVGIEVSGKTLALLGEFFELGYTCVAYPDMEIASLPEPELVSAFREFVNKNSKEIEK